MSDLISRSALLDKLIQCNGLGRKSFEAVVKVINESPTAYDVDAVVEQLEKASYLTTATFDEDGYCNDDSDDVVDLYRAIEIVKAGGVNEI